MTPFRDTVRFVDGIERNMNFFEQGYVILLCQGLRSDIEQLGATVEQISAHFVNLRLAERRVKEVRNAAVSRFEASDSIHLVFHQRDKRRNDDGSPGHQQSRKLVAEGLASACRHKDEGIASVHQVRNNLLLLAFEVIETEEIFEGLVNGYRIENHN